MRLGRDPRPASLAFFPCARHPVLCDGRHMTEQLPLNDKHTFDYLLREPRHARRLRQINNSTAGILALLAIAGVLYGCT